MMTRTVVVVGMLLLGAGAVVAQQDPVTQAQNIMKANGKNLGGVLSPMFKGDKPYDQAAVDAAGRGARAGVRRDGCQGR